MKVKTENGIENLNMFDIIKREIIRIIKTDPLIVKKCQELNKSEKDIMNDIFYNTKMSKNFTINNFKFKLTSAVLNIFDVVMDAKDYKQITNKLNKNLKSALYELLELKKIRILSRACE